MHGKAIASSYQRTACTAVKAQADLFPAPMFTAGVLTINAKYAVIQAEAQSLRYTTDGSTPTATAGYIIAAGERVTFTPAELATIKIIEASAGGYANAQLYSA